MYHYNRLIAKLTLQCVSAAFSNIINIGYIYSNCKGLQTNAAQYQVGQHEFCISKFFVQGVYLLLIMILIIRSVLIDGQNYSGIHAYQVQKFKLQQRQVVAFNSIDFKCIPTYSLKRVLELSLQLGNFYSLNFSDDKLICTSLLKY